MDDNTNKILDGLQEPTWKHPLESDKTIGWEERFDEKFTYVRHLKISDKVELLASIPELKEFIADLLATQNEEHQKLVLEEHALAKKMEQERIVKILEEWYEYNDFESLGDTFNVPSFGVGWKAALKKVITLITQ